ncbi:TetR/AcrR family transcriptional regulator [Microbacterium sp. NPDC055910]|uniref:TetR/AcrR family transcriptional regulator n=1 Tax=Microbacterium sp. NPDC055910 TaxID=3345659 RepID=UPI0035E1F272
MSAELSNEGRRARKRRETDDAIALASVELAIERGYDHTTVDEICRRADVSRSTFFNYYPSRDAAILGRSVPVLDDDAITAAFGAYRGDPVMGVIALAVSHVTSSDASDSRVTALRTRLLADEPVAVRQYSAALVTSQANLTDAAFRWLSANPQSARLARDPLREATLAVTAAYGVLYAAAEGWRVPVEALTDPASEVIRRLGQLRTVLGTTP